MKDVEEGLRKNICIFCCRHKCKKCLNLVKEKQNNITIYKCLNFIKEVNMQQFKDHIKYTFYDENGRLVAIVKENTPKDIVSKLSQAYDEVKYKED